jgi:hypothetical protein
MNARKPQLTYSAGSKTTSKRMIQQSLQEIGFVCPNRVLAQKLPKTTDPHLPPTAILK